MTVMLATAVSQARTLSEEVYAAQHKYIKSQVQTMGLTWKVGEQNNYKLDGGFFMQGSMSMTVTSIAPEGIWLEQVMDMGFMGKQTAQALIDANDGHTIKLIVNGEEQTIPEQDYEVIGMTEDNITVPAGNFDVVHVTIQDKTNNQQIEQWANLQLVPISGMVKSVTPYQFGTMTLELTSFNKM